MAKSKRFKIILTISIIAAVAIIGTIVLLIVYFTQNKSTFDYALKCARDDFGCKKILWIDTAVYGNAITGYYKENSDGSVTEVLSMSGGYFVVGEDSDGKNIYIVVPDVNDTEYKPTLFEWPFDHSFSEIAEWLGEYGYKYADGIDGKENEYRISSDRLQVYTDIDAIETHLKRLNKSDDVIDRLDKYVELVFRRTVDPDNNDFYDYTVVQENGELKLYEEYSADGSVVVRNFGDEH